MKNILSITLFNVLFVINISANGNNNGAVSFQEQEKNLKSSKDSNVILDPVTDTVKDNSIKNDSSLNMPKDSKPLGGQNVVSKSITENKELEISPRTIFAGNSADKLEAVINNNDNDALATKTKLEINEDFDAKMKKALAIINDNIVVILTGQPSNIDKIFSKLRNVFTTDEFSNDEIFDFIDDATEIRKKYPIILECVARIIYAKKAIEQGIPSNLALKLSSSDYIQLPNFILNKKINDAEFNQMISDIGCGVVWKDIAKYLIAVNKYYGNKNILNLKSFKNFPKRVQHYMLLSEEISKFFKEYKRHIDYNIAQNYLFGGIEIEKVKAIFSLSENEFKELCKPNDYENF